MFKFGMGHLFRFLGHGLTMASPVNVITRLGQSPCFIPRNHPVSRELTSVDQDNFVEVPLQVAQVMEEMKEAITKTSKAGPSGTRERGEKCWVFLYRNLGVEA